MRLPDEKRATGIVKNHSVSHEGHSWPSAQILSLIMQQARCDIGVAVRMQRRVVVRDKGSETSLGRGSAG